MFLVLLTKNILLVHCALKQKLGNQLCQKRNEQNLIIYFEPSKIVHCILLFVTLAQNAIVALAIQAGTKQKFIPQKS